MLPWLLRIPGFLRSPLAFGGCFHDPRSLDREFQQRYIARLSKPGPAVDGALRFLRCMKFSRLDRFRDLHGDIRVPTLFVWGEDDPTFPEPLARQMAGQFPSVAGFHSIADGRLFYYAEQPRELATRVERFLAAARTS